MQCVCQGDGVEPSNIAHADPPLETGRRLTGAVHWGGAPKEDSLRRSQFPEEQIVCIFKEHGAGAGTAPLCRVHGIGEPTSFRLRQKYRGMGAGGA